MNEWWIVNGGAVKELFFYGFWAGTGWMTSVILIKSVKRIFNTHGQPKASRHKNLMSQFSVKAVAMTFMADHQLRRME